MLKKSLSIILLSLNVNVALAAGDVEAGKVKSVTCGACHGPTGISSIPINPNIAGQVPGYIADQLKAFKSGERKNAIMAGQVIKLSDEDMADLDAFYSSQDAKVTSSLTDEQKELAEEGRKIYQGGFRERGISACMSLSLIHI